MDFFWSVARNSQRRADHKTKSTLLLELLRQGADNSEYISAELQSTKTNPWTFREDAQAWWAQEVMPQWQ